MPLFVFGSACGLLFFADRTGVWLKEHKQFDTWAFGGLSALALVAGFTTMQNVGKDLGFLNRDQTDEWKGWMQSKVHFYSLSKCLLVYRLYSCHSNISLFWRVKNIGHIQSNSCACRCVLIHDWLWTYDVLSQKGRFRIYPGRPDFGAIEPLDYCSGLCHEYR